MNVLFMCLGTFYDLNESSVHIDILKRFAKDQDVWLVCKNEERPTELKDENGIHVLRVRTGKLKGTGSIRKGMNTLLVEFQFKNAIKKKLTKVKFDLVLYTTPPITFVSAVEYIKRRDNADTYLMLKDIFPQNAVDIGMMSTSGIKGILYTYFRNKEKRLYKISNHIGCMSPANVRYILKHNPELNPKIVEICPNTTVIEDTGVNENTRLEIRGKYNIPLNKKVFIYGGNLGKPQGISFLVECLKKCKEKDCFFLIVGKGTEYKRIEQYINEEKPCNCKLMKVLPSNEFQTMVAACDVGMIFLDHRFTIPNFPSRLLSYMKSKVPVLAVTDPNTDIGEIIVEGRFGWWCESNDAEEFSRKIEYIISLDQSQINLMKKNEFKYLKEKYGVDVAYKTIMKVNQL